MTIPMLGLSPVDSLRLRWPVWGIDPSTRHMSAGILLPTQRALDAAAPVIAWDTLTLKLHDNLPLRQQLGYSQMVGWLRRLEGRFDRPGAIGLEVPMGYGTVPKESFYVIGVLLAAIGACWPDMLMLDFNAGEWKLAATGKGYAPGLPKTASKAAKRKAEKDRLKAWARDVCGWAGDLEDEADALGVAVATGVKVAGRLNLSDKGREPGEEGAG